jgi:hypothetical protein
MAIDGITIQPGMEQYMSRAGGACHILVRQPDDVAAATRGLEAFRADLFKGRLLGGGVTAWFGRGYTPNFATDVEGSAEGPTFWFDAKDTLEFQPALVPPMLKALSRRLRQAGVRHAEIGWPDGAYGDY